MSNDKVDTIVAIATSSGEAGIGIVRLSGPDAVRIVDSLFEAKSRKCLARVPSHTLHYGWIKDPEKKERILDEVLVSVMRSPRSYTREDVVEINCHGGPIALRAVLDACLSKGARLAEPGEFTKRAFLNGRIDLTQAEAVLDIVRAKTDMALSASQAQLKGQLSNRLTSLKEGIIKQQARLEVQIDFPEEEIGEVDFITIKKELNQILQQLNDLIKTERTGRYLHDGIRVVICGKPNVGKSSLLNALLQEERSIVTPVAGTTRDTIEEILDVKGFPIRIVDTAGILEPRDLVERKAVARSKQMIRQADLILLVFDASRPFDEMDKTMMYTVQKKKHIVAVLNKIDLPKRFDERKIKGFTKHLVYLSAKKRLNISELEDVLVNSIISSKTIHQESILVTSARHREALKKAQKCIAQAIDSLNNNVSLEYICLDLKEAVHYLDEIMGKSVSEDILDVIFSEFCIGK
ncbi:MAG: tRNA uridine-5-carboxymethylaminomethyl(34) synthesis GTPase MnmE [Candidatus Omnitrophica bacterium]|nr:tRNA uridine-5-carboxymethylaminomethyl(34) synthesis GTPase MnmE [Candidatus Omnitrophota bacterium]